MINGLLSFLIGKWILWVGLSIVIGIFLKIFGIDASKKLSRKMVFIIIGGILFILIASLFIWILYENLTYHS